MISRIVARRLLLVVLLIGSLAPASARAATFRVGVVEPADERRWAIVPEKLTIAVGDTVEFVNDGKIIHTFTEKDLRWDSGVLQAGQAWSYTFREPRVWEYLCFIHPQMVGTLTVVAPPPAGTPDFAVPGGWFFTQTGGGGGRGYAVTDEGGVRFWSEFKRFGGVQAVGYPASQRFEWDGFTVQVFQRVIFQWRPEVEQVYFVNVFDRLGELGKNEFLLRARQTPLPRQFADAGKAWPEVVNNHLAVLEPFPAIKAKYYDVVGDPIQANGLPVSDVTDMGNHWALRAQRVVLQEWKEDVPWARRGQVTVALGGDIAKEAGVLPGPIALQSVPAPR